MVADYFPWLNPLSGAGIWQILLLKHFTRQRCELTEGNWKEKSFYKSDLAWRCSSCFLLYQLVLRIWDSVLQIRDSLNRMVVQKCLLDNGKVFPPPNLRHWNCQFMTECHIWLSCVSSATKRSTAKTKVKEKGLCLQWQHPPPQAFVFCGLRL